MTVTTIHANGRGTNNNCNGVLYVNPDEYKDTNGATEGPSTTINSALHKTDYQRDTYAFDDISIGSNVISSVKVYVKANGQVGRPNLSQILRAVVRTHSTEYAHATEQTVYDNSYVLFSWEWTLNNYTGVAWTQTEVNDAEFGFDTKNNADAGVTYVDWLYVEVTHAPASSSSWAGTWGG